MIANLDDFNDDWTIYAVEPWTADSPAIVEPAPDDTTAPPQGALNGMTYFIEVFIAREFADGHSEHTHCTQQELVARVIHYARYDA